MVPSAHRQAPPVTQTHRIVLLSPCAVLVHEIEDSLTKTRGIVAMRLNETHTLGLPVTVNTSNTDREPFVAYHPPSNNFVVVWEWDNDKDNVRVTYNGHRSF